MSSIKIVVFARFIKKHIQKDTLHKPRHSRQ